MRDEKKKKRVGVVKRGSLFNVPLSLLGERNGRYDASATHNVFSKKKKKRERERDWFNYDETSIPSGNVIVR